MYVQAIAGSPPRTRLVRDSVFGHTDLSVRHGSKSTVRAFVVCIIGDRNPRARCLVFSFVAGPSAVCKSIPVLYFHYYFLTNAKLLYTRGSRHLRARGHGEHVRVESHATPCPVHATARLGVRCPVLGQDGSLVSGLGWHIHGESPVGNNTGGVPNSNTIHVLYRLNNTSYY